jgi:hypothetical protein
VKGTEMQSTITKYGIENLKVLIIDNNRTYHFDNTDFNNNKVLLDHTNEYIELKELARDGVTPTIVHIPYEFIQTLVFKDNNPSDPLPTT